MIQLLKRWKYCSLHLKRFIAKRYKSQTPTFLSTWIMPACSGNVRSWNQTWDSRTAKTTEKRRERTSARKRINFAKISSDGFSRHLGHILWPYKVVKMTIFKQFFYALGTPTLEKHRIRGEISSLWNTWKTTHGEQESAVYFSNWNVGLPVVKHRFPQYREWNGPGTWVLTWGYTRVFMLILDLQLLSYWAQVLKTPKTITAGHIVSV
jgi:hypothetical protein